MNPICHDGRLFDDKCLRVWLNRIEISASGRFESRPIELDHILESSAETEALFAQVASDLQAAVLSNTGTPVLAHTI